MVLQKIPDLTQGVQNKVSQRGNSQIFPGVCLTQGIVCLKLGVFSKTPPGFSLPLKGFAKHRLGNPKYPGVFSNLALFGSLLGSRMKLEMGFQL